MYNTDHKMKIAEGEQYSPYHYYTRDAADADLEDDRDYYDYEGDLDAEDATSYDDSSYLNEAFDGVGDPVEFMKHGTQRHKDIIKKRQGKGQEQAQGQAKKAKKDKTEKKVKKDKKRADKR